MSEIKPTTMSVVIRTPSCERGCVGKMALSLREDPHKKAQKLARKHGKDFGIYHCPYCDKYHLTSKLDKQREYAPLLYQTNFFDSAT